jgi:hypothetical protein
MARTLLWTVKEMFRNKYVGGKTVSNYRNRPEPNNMVRYLEIPIQQDIFEVPLFALNTFMELVTSGRASDVEAIVTCLITQNRISYYKTLDRSMKDLLNESYENSRLVRMEVGSGENKVLYYVTHGAVFDNEFNPIMIATWQIRRHLMDAEDSKWVYKYEFIKPVVHINPDTFLTKDDQMRRFICNKLANTCLEEKMNYPDADSFHFVEKGRRESISVKIDIDDIPFTILDTDIPSVSTTNKQLLQLAIDYIDEITQ